MSFDQSENNRRGDKRQMRDTIIVWDGNGIDLFFSKTRSEHVMQVLVKGCLFRVEKKEKSAVTGYKQRPFTGHWNAYIRHNASDVTT